MEVEVLQKREGLFKRRVVAILTVVVILGSAKGITMMMGKMAGQKGKGKVVTSLVVDTITVHHSTYTLATTVTGRVEALNRIDLVPEVSGVLLKSRHSFREGTKIRKGQLIFAIDEGSARYDLLSQKSSFLNQLVSILPDMKIDFPQRREAWENYLANFDPQKKISALPTPQSSKERYFLASRNILTNYYAIKSAEEKIDMYRVYAPFSGVITVALVTTGSRVSVGQKIGEFSSGAPFEFKADVPASIIKGMSIGDTVTLTSTFEPKEYYGVISRINKQIAQGSQTVSVSVTINDTTLLEGAYLRANFTSRTYDDALVLPSRFIYDGNRVALDSSGVTLYKDVEILSQGDGVTTVRGIADGTLVVRR